MVIVPRAVRRYHSYFAFRPVDDPGRRPSLKVLKKPMLILFCLFLLLVPPLCADHNPLVPRPQHIRYGDGRLALAGVSISFESAPAAEDLFAADELASALAAASGARVQVV